MWTWGVREACLFWSCIDVIVVRVNVSRRFGHSPQWGSTVRTLINRQMERFAWTNHIYFQITQSGSSTVTSLYQYSNRGGSIPIEAAESSYQFVKIDFDSGHFRQRYPVLWNRNYFIRFRFRLLKSYGSGSDFWKVAVPVRQVPVPVSQHWRHRYTFSCEFLGGGSGAPPVLWAYSRARPAFTSCTFFIHKKNEERYRTLGSFFIPILRWFKSVLGIRIH